MAELAAPPAVKDLKIIAGDMILGLNGTHMGAPDEPRPGNCRKLRCGLFGMNPGVP